MLSNTATLRNSLFQLCVNPEIKKMQRDASQCFALLKEHLVSHHYTVEWTDYNKSHNAAQYHDSDSSSSAAVTKTTGAQKYEKLPFHALFSPDSTLYSNRSGCTWKSVFLSSGMEFAMVSWINASARVSLCTRALCLARFANERLRCFCSAHLWLIALLNWDS